MKDSSLNLISKRHTYYWILACILLNSADSFFTYLALANGLSELNPLMAVLIRLNMCLFMFNKLVLVNSWIWFLGYIGRSYRVGRWGLAFATLTYAILAIYHLVNICVIFMINGL